MLAISDAAYLLTLAGCDLMTKEPTTRAGTVRLTHVQVTNFRNIDDSTEFKIDDVTCLVGKNESGKTTVLQALERLNSANAGRGKYSKLQDYPRKHWADYEDRHKSREARVLQTKWTLDTEDIEAVEKLLGRESLRGKNIEVAKQYETVGSLWTVPLNEKGVAEAYAREAGGCRADLLRHGKSIQISW